jgi:hypothetical protein
MSSTSPAHQASTNPTTTAATYAAVSSQKYMAAVISKTRPNPLTSDRMALANLTDERREKQMSDSESALNDLNEQTPTAKSSVRLMKLSRDNYNWTIVVNVGEDIETVRKAKDIAITISTEIRQSLLT